MATKLRENTGFPSDPFNHNSTKEWGTNNAISSEDFDEFRHSIGYDEIDKIITDFIICQNYYGALIMATMHGRNTDEIYKKHNTDTKRIKYPVIIPAPAIATSVKEKSKFSQRIKNTFFDEKETQSLEAFNVNIDFAIKLTKKLKKLGFSKNQAIYFLETNFTNSDNIKTLLAVYKYMPKEERPEKVVELLFECGNSIILRTLIEFSPEEITSIISLQSEITTYRILEEAIAYKDHEGEIDFRWFEHHLAEGNLYTSDSDSYVTCAMDLDELDE